MNKSVLASFIALTAAHMGLATPTITDVTAQQRYPWNGKVDITYTISGDIATTAKEQGLITSLKVMAVDGETSQTYTATSLSGDTSLLDGTHSIVWDMDADGLTFKSTNVVFSVSCEATSATYCVIDLSAGANASSYSVTYLAEPPSGGFNVDEYKMTKLVLKRIEAGTFIMGDNQAEESHRVTLTNPFFVGLFEVTQKQYSLVTGSNPSTFSGDKLPVEEVSYNAIRGSSSGAQWPASNAVDASSFMGQLRARTGLDFDLPTEAQWEYACRAGTTTTYSHGNSADGNYMWYASNSSSRTHEVGTKQPNPWGLYDMHGNVWERCLDRSGTLTYGTDPKGSSTGADQVQRGGSWSKNASGCTSSSRYNFSPSRGYNDLGLRLALPAKNAIRVIHFLANGGTGTMNNVILVGAETANLPPVGFVGPDGADFLGWATNSDGLVEYLDGASTEGLSPTEDDVTLYAKWDRGSFKIRFDANGGTGNMADQTIPLDLPQALPNCAYEREDHYFVGWATDPGGAAVFSNGEIVSNLAVANGLVMLYAIWREGAPGLAIRYYDTYDYGYPAFGKSESDMIAYFGSHEPTLSTNSYDWGATLDSGFMREDIFPDIDGLWRENSATNRYHGAYAAKSKDHFAVALGGFLDVRKAGTYRFAASADDEIALYIDGVFICGNDVWYEIAYGEIVLSSGLHRIETGMYERDAHHGMFVAWKRPGDTSYTPIPQAKLSHQTGSDMLEFFPGDGVGQMSPIAVDRNFGALLPKCTFAKTGYSPAWALEPNGHAVYADGDGVPPGISALFAVWSINQYTVSFNSNDGTEVPSITQDYGSFINAPANPIRTGYTFRGWTPPVPATMPPNDTECIASWRANTYTIRFSANGGTGSMTDFRLAYDTTISLPPVEYAGPNGAAFLGWATTPDGLVEYGNEANIRNLSSVAGDVITLYAKWNRGSFTVHFDANGGTDGYMADRTIPLDVPQTLPSCDYERENHLFVGWATTSDGAVAFADGEKVWNMAASGEAVTLYAVWREGPPLYCVLDLSSGASAASYPVSYLAVPPSGGFNTDEFKTTKLVLRRIEPGTFMMCGNCETTLTNPYYIGIFEVTQRQYELVMGSNPSYFVGDKRPVERVSFTMARGSNLGSQWPLSDAVDSDSFMGKLRSRTGLNFDLPTEARWEYACRAGTTTTYSYGNFEDGDYMWYNSNSSSQTHDVGTKKPNPWGLYDMHGNVLELCLDWYEGNLSGGTNPTGPSSSSVQRRVGRGGSWNGGASRCTSSDRDRDRPHYVFTGTGYSSIRLILNVNE